MAVVDVNLSFIFIDFGAYGREADSNVFRQSVFRKKMYTNHGYRHRLELADTVLEDKVGQLFNQRSAYDV